MYRVPPWRDEGEDEALASSPTESRRGGMKVKMKL